MRYESFYLSEVENIEKALAITGLALDELEGLVGRFTKTSSRAGLLRGEVVSDIEGVYIRHHFTKKILWRSDD